MAAVTGDYKLSPTEQNEWYKDENRRLEKKVNKYQEEIESMQRNGYPSDEWSVNQHQVSSWEFRCDDLEKENKRLLEELKKGQDQFLELAKKLHDATTDAIAAKVALQVSLRTLRMKLSEQDFDEWVSFTTSYMQQLGMIK